MPQLSRLSPAERTILLYGVLGALGALALHAALKHHVWPWRSTYATMFAIQFAWLVPLAGALLAGMPSARRWLAALLAFGVVLPALHAYSLTTLLGPLPVDGDSTGLRAVATLVTASSAFLLLPLVQALDPTAPHWNYPAVFRAAWRNTVTLALAGGLALAVSLLFWATGQMFRMIGIIMVDDLVQSIWFTLTVMPLVLALCLAAVRRRPQLADTLQRSWLTLTAWLLPLVALIGIAFVLALAARLTLDLQAGALSAGALIAFSALWIKLINSAWQDSPDAPPFGPRLRAVLRVAAIGLLPLALVALYGLAVRVQQYGWTTPRVWGIYLAALLVVYAAGYALAAWAPRRFHAILGATNIAAALCALAMLAAVQTPLLSPDRLTVDSQIQRLVDGRVPPGDFRYLSMARDHGDYGRHALQRLADGAAQAQSPEIAIAAELALKGNYYDWGDPRRTGSRIAKSPAMPTFNVYPAGSAVPEGWWAAATLSAPFQTSNCISADQAASKDAAAAHRRCWLIHADVTGAGANDLVLYVPPRTFTEADGYEEFITYTQDPDGTWRRVGAQSQRWTEDRQPNDIGNALAQGQVSTQPRTDRDLIVGGRRLPLH
jgi:hypothetical protein